MYEYLATYHICDVRVRRTWERHVLLVEEIGISEENMYTARKYGVWDSRSTGACYYGVARCALFFSRDFPGIGVSSAGRVGTVTLNAPSHERSASRRLREVSHDVSRCSRREALPEIRRSSELDGSQLLSRHVSFHLDWFTEFENFARSFTACQRLLSAVNYPRINYLGINIYII